MRTERTALEWISELVLRLTIIATESDAWEQYQLSGESRDVVIDRIENGIETYIRQLEVEFSGLYDQLQEASDALQPFAQFSNIKAHQHEHVTISVPIEALQNARAMLGGAFRDYNSTEDIPL